MPGKRHGLRIAPETATYLRGPGRGALGDLERRVGFEIGLVAAPGARERIDLVPVP